MVQNGVPNTGSIGAGGDTFAAPTGGRGSLSYTVNGITHSAEYYVVSSSKFLLLDTTTGILSVGLAEQQSNVTFLAASLSVVCFWQQRRDDNAPFVNTEGSSRPTEFQVTAATFDSVQDGSVASDQTATGTYLIVTIPLATDPELYHRGPYARHLDGEPNAGLIALNGTNVEDGTDPSAKRHLHQQQLERPGGVIHGWI